MGARPPTPKQRVAYTFNPNDCPGTSDELESYLLVGDPDYDEYEHKAIPMLLADGWKVNQVVSSGDGDWIFVFDAPEKGSK